jgi:HD superfamily phosphohydrolase
MMTTDISSDIPSDISLLSPKDILSEMALLPTKDNLLTKNAKTRVIYSKLFGCSVHGQIRVSAPANKIIDTPEFQRMRGLKQLGTAIYVFQCATHTRFEHSLGVYYLAGELLKNLKQNHSNVRFTISELGTNLKLNNFICELIKIAGLCHDIGHGPFSHVFDDLILADSTDPNKSHEHRSALIIEQIIKRELSGYLKDNHIQFIKNLINPKPEHTGFIYQIISNNLNGIDVDKLDYLARDIRQLGLRSGYDCERIISETRIDNNNNLSYPKQLAYHISELFHTRYTMHKEIYSHKTVKIIEYMLYDIINLIDPIFHIRDSIKDLNSFCRLTDETIFEYLNMFIFPNELLTIKLSREHKRNINKAIVLYQRIIKRKLYRFIGEIINYPSIKAEHFLEINKDIDLNNIIICQYKIGYVSGDKKDPFDSIYFYDKKELKESFILSKEKVSMLITNNYQEHYTRIFCRDRKQAGLIKDAFQQIISNRNIIKID